MTILNLTQHTATLEQIKDGVVDIPSPYCIKVRDLLTFNDIPNKNELIHRANEIVTIVKQLNFTRVMIGGAPYFMTVLERVLKDNSIVPMYSFSQRQSIERIKEDGTVEKLSVFKHIGFVNA